MKYIVWIAATVLAAASIVIAQAPAPAADQNKTAPKGKGKAQAKGPVNPAQSPASRPGPRTTTEQTYAPALVRAGEQRFTAQCGFCHGRDASGGEGGPDLTRSELVADDNRGDKIIAVIRAGRPAQGGEEAMPAFTLSQGDLDSIVAFVHDRKTKSESESGGRQSVADSDLATGNSDAGRAYFAKSCATCHSPTGDLAGLATRFKGLALMQRFLYPTSGRPAPKRPTVTVTLASGQTVSGSLAAEDEFSVTVLDAANARQSYPKSTVKYKIDDPMSAHFDLLGKYTDTDIHNLFAFLDTLK